MPELPEVETVVSGIKSLVGSKISGVIVRQASLRYLVDTLELEALINSPIISIYRRAKYIIINLPKTNLVIHLGMSGSLLLTDTNKAPSKHDHVDILLDKYVLRYNDPRRFGCILCIKDISTSKLFTHLGPEPLTEEFNATYLFNLTRGKLSKIKQLIMDNHIVVGVGNIYANEALFLSKINPSTKSNLLSQKQCIALVNNIKQVLTKAIASGGSSLRDYQKADGTLGYFQHTHLVYNKQGKPCAVCSTPIQAIRLGQRNSFYCPYCQI